MARNLHSVSSDEPEAHGRFYNMLAGVGEKLDSLYDRIFGDEVICKNPELPFTGSTPGDSEHQQAHESNAGK